MISLSKEGYPKFGTGPEIAHKQHFWTTKCKLLDETKRAKNSFSTKKKRKNNYITRLEGQK